MRRLIFTALLVSLCLVAAARMVYTANHEHRTDTEMTANDLRNNLKKLWEDHTVALNNYIDSLFRSGEDSEKAREELHRSANAIGDILKEYYGDEAGEKLSSLLREHISVVPRVIMAVRTNSYQDLKNAQQEWNVNADVLSGFLNGLNPLWTEQALKEMLYQHLDLVSEAIMSRYAGSDSGGTDSSDRDHELMLKFADRLADGIIKQFSGRFRK